MIFLVIFALILLNGLLAMGEIALVSSRKSKLKELIKQNKRGAREALEMARNPVNFFSTIQVGVTFVGVILGALGEQSLTPALSAFIKTIPILEIYHKPISFLLTIGALTYLTLIIGELVPKRIAVSNPEVISSFIAPPILMLLNLTFPLVRVFGKSTEVVLGLLKIKPLAGSARNQQEENTVLTDKENQGDIYGQIDMVYFNNLPVNTFMTPRSEIQWFDIDTYSHKDIRSHYATYPFSQVVFCSESLDHVIGVIHIKELLRHYLINPHFDIKSSVQKPHIFPENTLALQILDKFGSTPAQVAFIQDNNGKTKGMVTPDDIMRACVKNGRYRQSSV